MFLYVDDRREAPEGWVLARTNTEAIRLISTCEIEKCSLDYNIGVRLEVELDGNQGEAWVDLPETFEPTAYFISLMSPATRPEMSYHSDDNAGTKRLQQIIGASPEY